MPVSILPERLKRALTHLFSPTTTPLQATTYLLGISLFSITFLVFLNSGISFVVTDLIGRRERVGDVVGTLGFADELVALVACPAWGLVSDRLGVRWVAVLGYAIIAMALAVFVQARNVYPQLLLARVFFAVGATAAATMVTAILPSLTDESAAFARPSHQKPPSRDGRSPAGHARYNETDCSSDDVLATPQIPLSIRRKPSVLAGYVGLFTGCGALVALSCFLPLPARFGEIEGVTPGQAVEYSFYVVAAVSACVAVFVFFGLRGIRGEEGKGWRVL
jgi:nitrate/nitrite transporter NarK